MAKTERNLKSAEDFLRSTLAETFGQKLEGEKLRQAAERLCAAMPEKECEPA